MYNQYKLCCGDNVGLYGRVVECSNRAAISVRGWEHAVPDTLVPSVVEHLDLVTNIDHYKVGKMLHVNLLPVFDDLEAGYFIVLEEEDDVANIGVGMKAIDEVLAGTGCIVADLSVDERLLGCGATAEYSLLQLERRQLASLAWSMDSWWSQMVHRTCRMLALVQSWRSRRESGLWRYLAESLAAWRETRRVRMVAISSWINSTSLKMAQRLLSVEESSSSKESVTVGKKMANRKRWCRYRPREDAEWTLYPLPAAQHPLSPSIDLLNIELI